MSTSSLNRRQFLRAGAAAGAGLVAFPGRAPAFVRSRPQLTHGIQSGDVTTDAGFVWARADRASRMLVEVSPTPRFNHGRGRVGSALLTPDHDFAGKVLVDHLPPGQQVFYRVTLEDFGGVRSEPLVGSFRTAPRSRRDVSFTWSGDLAGQGWGINPDIGGYRIFKTMAGLEPDFFLCSGDTIYADNPLSPTVPLPGGRTWRNIVAPGKEKVCETLDEFRGAFAYNLLDENLRAFAATVPQINQWDDHEVHNNWYPGQILADDRYTERRTDVLSARAKQAFFEWLPIGSQRRDEVGRIYRKISHGPLLDVFMLDMRTYKDPNGTDVYADPTIGLLGQAQREWLKRELAASRATWKLIANDLPLGLVVPDTPGTIEGVAQGDNGPPLGRELEFAEVLRFAHQRGVTGMVFVTTDVHYTSAHHYDPARAAIGDFTPFWEFVSGPLNAGAFGPNTLDLTFGGQTMFAKAPPAPNVSPADGFQFFGHVAIDGHSEVMTVTLYDLDGNSLFSVDLDPS
ncbi:MAG TPA: alkaline phosphatase D family protein [Solirubrobacteraceae bacterium]|nr:alkaline phosphatase D family protein [Solirubrobacteraceae bacterium]